MDVFVLIVVIGIGVMIGWMILAVWRRNDGKA
jgi:hypothetical protein